ncbi:MAG: DUF4416 family protein [Desulfovibrionaceae bacterium]
MSRPREPEPGLRLVSALLRAGDPDGLWPGLVARMQALWGPVERVGADLPFDRTDFYRAEMGGPLVRRVAAFAELAPLDGLVEAKLACLALEDGLRRPDGGRRVNLDPGLVTPERLVLATCKNFTHRVYLGRRVWADLTLVYTGGDWMVLPWTFPDYAAGPLREEITVLRALCLDKLRRLRITTSHQPEETPCP